MVGAVLLEVCGGHRHHVGDRRHRQRVGDETGEQGLDPTAENSIDIFPYILSPLQQNRNLRDKVKSESSVNVLRNGKSE